MPNKTHTYIRHCRKCKKLFKPSGKRNFVCPKCRLKNRNLKKNKKVKKVQKPKSVKRITRVKKKK